MRFDPKAAAFTLALIAGTAFLTFDCFLAAFIFFVLSFLVAVLT